MGNLQKGSTAIAAIIVIALVGLLSGYTYHRGAMSGESERLKISQKLTELEGQLTAEKGKVESLSEEVEKKNREIKLLTDIVEVNKSVVLERERKITSLEKEIADIMGTLPTPKKRDPSKVVVEAEESDSMKRYDVLQSVYEAVVSPEDVFKMVPEKTSLNWTPMSLESFVCPHPGVKILSIHDPNPIFLSEVKS